MRTISISVAALAAIAVSSCEESDPGVDPSAPAVSADSAAPVSADSAEEATGAMKSSDRTDQDAASDAPRTTASGLKFWVMKKGDGKVNPKATDTVTVHYHGTLLDGTIFDSSVDRGEPSSFPLNRVIAGWTEGVQLMKVGDKFKFEIPAELAYGAGGRPPVIPPNSPLVFEVELLEIK